jgi:hypothetical protein
MRIIPDNIIPTYDEVTDTIYLSKSYIVEISDSELDKIGLDYRLYSRKLSATYKPFSEYLRELVSLTGEKR